MHLPIDHFLRSLAEDSADRAICVILSGTASDGAEGIRSVKASGGITFAQDEQSAKYDGMPQSAVNTGCVDFVLPPSAIARELARVAQHPYLAPAAAEKAELTIAPGNQMETLLSLLRVASGCRLYALQGHYAAKAYQAPHDITQARKSWRLCPLHQAPAG
jgi:two-component system CheB/CheR fusion protein